MKAVIQRVSYCRLSIAQIEKVAIGEGLLVLLGISSEDTLEDVNWLSKKMANLRIFSDEVGKMNRSVQDIDGEILLVSQFTLMGNVRKGNRPSFISAASPENAIPLYEAMIKRLSLDIQKPIATGVFGAAMQIELANNGPVTIIIDTKE